MWRGYFFLVLAAAVCAQPLPDRLREAAAKKAQGDAPGALAAYEEAARLAPKSAEVQHEIGFLMAVLKRPQEAQQHFREAVRLDPNYAAAHHLLGVSLWLSGEREEAIKELRASVRLRPADVVYRTRLGDALYQSAMPGEAVVHFQAAAEGKKTDPKLWNQLGVTRGQMDVAEK